uniref:Transposase n=1 Tax=Ascaris lumbricoides TaxID=6252 RepID=A0A0M3HF81_ASCLU
RLCSFSALAVKYIAHRFIGEYDAGRGEFFAWGPMCVLRRSERIKTNIALARKRSSELAKRFDVDAVRILAEFGPTLFLTC